MKTNALKIDPKNAEKIRKLLIKNNLLRIDLKIEKDDKFIYLPIVDLSSELKNYQIVEKDFKENRKKIRNYKEILDIPLFLKKELPNSFDIIGDIILIKLSNSLQKYKKKIGKAILISYKNIKTVCLAYPVKGELRKRDIEIIAGEKQTKTIHIEYGIKLIIDIKKVYFSSRLANERRRVSKIVKPGEIVIDMFAGVAPFSIMIAKYSDAKIIYSIDKNKDAVKYAKKNIIINKLSDKIEIICADSKKILDIFKKKGIKVDRIIMNLPFSAHLFFNDALKVANDNCIIHYYDVLKEDEFKNRIDLLTKLSKEVGFELINMHINKIKTYAPREFYIGIDIMAKKIIADVA